MSRNYVKVASVGILKETIQLMRESRQNCALVVDIEDLLEGILTAGDIHRRVYNISADVPNAPKIDSTAFDVCILNNFFLEIYFYIFILKILSTLLLIGILIYYSTQW